MWISAHSFTRIKTPRRGNTKQSSFNSLSVSLTALPIVRTKCKKFGRTRGKKNEEINDFLSNVNAPGQIRKLCLGQRCYARTAYDRMSSVLIPMHRESKRSKERSERKIEKKNGGKKTGSIFSRDGCSLPQIRGITYGLTEVILIRILFFFFLSILKTNSGKCSTYE